MRHLVAGWKKRLLTQSDLGKKYKNIRQEISVPYAGCVTQPMSEPIPVLLKWFQMVGIPIKNLLRVLGQGEYDLVAVFAPARCVCHWPLLWYAWPSSARGYESNCDCDSVVSKTLEWPRVSMRRHTQTHTYTHMHTVPILGHWLLQPIWLSLILWFSLSASLSHTTEFVIS